MSLLRGGKVRPDDGQGRRAEDGVSERDLGGHAFRFGKLYHFGRNGKVLQTNAGAVEERDFIIRAAARMGAVINGTYELEGGWTGSLQGTLVNRKIFLVRIDSKLGKSMELEGYLSSDGERSRGSWLNYELAGSEGATGQWTAERQDGPR